MKRSQVVKAQTESCQLEGIPRQLHAFVVNSVRFCHEDHAADFEQMCQTHIKTLQNMNYNVQVKNRLGELQSGFDALKASLAAGNCIDAEVLFLLFGFANCTNMMDAQGQAIPLWQLINPLLANSHSNLKLHIFAVVSPPPPEVRSPADVVDPTGPYTLEEFHSTHFSNFYKSVVTMRNRMKQNVFERLHNKVNYIYVPCPVWLGQNQPNPRLADCISLSLMLAALQSGRQERLTWWEVADRIKKSIDQQLELTEDLSPLVHCGDNFQF